MKKTIMLSLIVSSLVMGANTADNLVIDQKNEITTNSTIDNATVDQGKTEILGASDVDNVTVKQGSSNTTGNLIENSDISQTTENGSKTTVSQGHLKIDSSTASNLKLESRNTIKDIEITNTLIEQGNFIVEGGSTAKDTLASGTEELTSTNIIKNIEADGVDIDKSTIHQSRTQISNGATTDKLQLLNRNKLENSTMDNSKVYQSKLKVDDSTATVLEVGLNDDSSEFENTINGSEIKGESVIKQSDITIENSSTVNTLVSKGTNSIKNFSADKSLISQNEMFIDNSEVTNFKTTQTNTIEGATVENDTYTTWSNAIDITNPTTISQGSTTIN